MELTIDEALHKAVESHKAGQLQEAEHLYSAILKVQPKHPDANHNMGVLAVGVGKVQEALPFFETALKANPSTAQFWLSYIDTLIKLDRRADARAVLGQAKSNGAKGDGFDKLEKRLNEADRKPSAPRNTSTGSLPQQPNILDNLKLDQAIKLAKKKSTGGSPEEAKRIYQDILTKFPKNKRASDGLKALTGGSVSDASEAQDPPEDKRQNLINLYHQGLLQQALTQAETLVQQYPKSSFLFNIQGAILKGLGQLDRSVEAYEKAITIEPDYAEAFYNMGNALRQQVKLDEAIGAYEKATAFKSNYAEAYHNMGTALQDLGKLDEAIAAYKKAIGIKPDYAEVLYNMGNAFRQQGKRDEAIVAYSKAIAMKPDYAEAYHNMGATHNEQGNMEEAVEAYKKAIDIKPDYASAYKNASEILKIYTPFKDISHGLFGSDNEIKKLNSKLLAAKSDEEIIDKIAEGLRYVSDDNSFKYKTPFSQIYKRNSVDLNCERHKQIFDTKDIIPEFCFGCYKVQVELLTVVDLIKVTSIFYKFNFDEDLTKKTIIETRPNIPGYYKGLIYCKGLDQAKAVRNALNIELESVFGEMVVSEIKRGCSEYPLRFPAYGKIDENSKNMMKFPNEWKLIEDQFDKNNLIKPKFNKQKSLEGFCLSDFYIIQKWIDYAKGIDDPSIEAFNDRPIIYKNIYEMAKDRVRCGIT
jgi:tetratricopeptide (TPR) repeat protein